jgi:hypothetical protein
VHYGAKSTRFPVCPLTLQQLIKLKLRERFTRRAQLGYALKNYFVGVAVEIVCVDDGADAVVGSVVQQATG